MSTKYRFTENTMPHFITCTLVEWIDLFNREKYKEILTDSLKYCINKKGLTVNAYVIMSNHIHLIARSENDVALSGIITDFRRFTAGKLYKELKSDSTESRRNWLLWIIESQGKRSSSNQTFKVWRNENHPVVLQSDTMMKERIDYIHNNPVRAGICYTPEDYKYSSAGQFAGETGLLDIEMLW